MGEAARLDGAIGETGERVEEVGCVGDDGAALRLVARMPLAVAVDDVIALGDQHSEVPLAALVVGLHHGDAPA